MKAVEATFVVPSRIAKGLQSEEYVRVGGVIRDAQTGHIVAMLREVAPSLSQASTILSQFGSIASILNLGVTVIGFAIVINRLGKIEQRLKQTQEDVNRLHRKFDLSIYANFRTALDLARDAFTMSKPENRINMANSAINRFLEAQHTYTGYVDIALKEDVRVADEYLSSLFLTYVARTRCYLELEESKTACYCLQEGTEILRPFVEQYVKKLLISTPVASCSPNLTGGGGYMWGGTRLSSPVNLSRLVQICQWLVPTLDNNLDEESILLEAQSKKLVRFTYPGVAEAVGVTTPVAAVLGIARQVAAVNPYVWIPMKSVDIFNPTTKGSNPTAEDHYPDRLLKTMEKIEAMIETYRRFEAYQAEIQTIAQLGVSFPDWLRLTPAEVKPNGAEVMYIIPSKPLEV